MSYQIKVADYATDPQIESHARAFLKIMNAGTGKPIEKMTYAEARKYWKMYKLQNRETFQVLTLLKK